jgi:small subunit ribosomal protein S17
MAENENTTPEPEDEAVQVPEPEAADAAVPEASAEEAEPAAEAVEAAAEAEEPVETLVPEAEVAAEGDADEEDAAPAAPVAEPKRKKKRLPRALRPSRTKRKREPAATRKPIVRLVKPEHPRGRRQERQGTVVSDAMDKTIVVRVDTITAHRKYKKVVRRSRKFHAHDERNEAKVGDVVRIVETRPLSALKRWRLTEIVQQAK